MKTIVVPTDFSSSAEHATLYAAHLAKAVNATVLLLHVYQLPVTMSDFPVLIVSAEELKNNADQALHRAREAAQNLVPDVIFETESRMGDIVAEIEEACGSRDTIALVSGTKDMSGFERFLVGNTTLSIVKKTTYPVIAVPEQAEIKTPRKLALAVDLIHSDEIPVQKIKAFVALFEAELHLVHVEKEGEETTPGNLPEGLQDVTFHSFKEEDVTKGIQQFVTTNQIDLVIVLPHKHNLYKRLFSKGHTEGLIHDMPVPVLCMHP